MKDQHTNHKKKRKKKLSLEEEQTLEARKVVWKEAYEETHS